MRGNSTYQIPFTGIPFVILKKKYGLYTGNRSLHINKKENAGEENKKVRAIVNFSPAKERF